jgi:hypothetical protein
MKQVTQESITNSILFATSNFEAKKMIKRKEGRDWKQEERGRIV